MAHRFATIHYVTDRRRRRTQQCTNSATVSSLRSAKNRSYSCSGCIKVWLFRLCAVLSKSMSVVLEQIAYRISVVESTSSSLKMNNSKFTRQMAPLNVFPLTNTIYAARKCLYSNTSLNHTTYRSTVCFYACLSTCETLSYHIELSVCLAQ